MSIEHVKSEYILSRNSHIYDIINDVVDQVGGKTVPLLLNKKVVDYQALQSKILYIANIKVS